MTEPIILEPFPIGATAEDDERLRNEEELRAQLAGIRVPAPAPLSSQAQALGQDVGAPPAQRRALEAQAPQADRLGAQFRAQPPSGGPGQLAPGARPDSPMRVYPPGQLPPRNPAMAQRTNAELLGDPPEQTPRRAALEAALRRIGGQARPSPMPSWMDEPAEGEPPPTQLNFSPGRLMNFSPNDEIYGRASDSDPVLPGHVRGAPAEPSVRSALPAVDAVAERLGAPAQPLPPSRERLRASMEERLKAAGKSAPRQAEPQRPDYTGVDVADAIRRPFHALGSALRAAAGASPTPFRSEGEAARARDQRTALAEQRAAQEARGDAMDEREMALRERSADSLDADRRERNDRLRGQADALARYRTETTQIARMRAEGQLTEDQAQAAEANARRSLLEAQADPSSAASESARARFGQRVGLIEQATGRDLDVDTAGMSAADIRALESGTGVPRWGAARSGGGGGSGRSTALDTPPEGWRGTPEQWAALPMSRRQSVAAQLGARAPRRGELGEGSTWTPRGWRDVDQRELDVTERRRIRDAGAESQRLSGQIRRLEELSRSVGALERAGGSVGAITESLAEARALHENIVNGLRVAGNYGVPTGTEMERMERLAPSLEDARSFAASGRQYGGILSAHNRAMDSWMGSYGVERDVPRQGSGNPRAQAQANEAARGAQDGDVIFVYNGHRSRIRAADAAQARERLRAARIEFTEETSP